MPCPFTDPKIFCAGPNFLSHSKNLTPFSASSITFVPAQKPILMNSSYLFVWHKKFRPAQNILGPVKGQGMNLVIFDSTDHILTYLGTDFILGKIFLTRTLELWTLK